MGFGDGDEDVYHGWGFWMERVIDLFILGRA